MNLFQERKKQSKKEKKIFLKSFSVFVGQTTARLITYSFCFVVLLHRKHVNEGEFVVAFNAHFEVCLHTKTSGNFF